MGTGELPVVISNAEKTQKGSLQGGTADKSETGSPVIDNKLIIAVSPLN